METQGQIPTPDEAAAALREAERAEAAGAWPETPLWYWPAFGVVVGVLPFTTLMPTDTTTGMLVWLATVLASALALGLFVSKVGAKTGIRHRLTRRALLPYLVLGAIVVVLAVIAGFTNRAWIAFGALELYFAGVVVTGLRSQLRARRRAG